MLSATSRPQRAPRKSRKTSVLPRLSAASMTLVARTASLGAIPFGLCGRRGGRVGCGLRLSVVSSGCRQVLVEFSPSCTSMASTHRGNAECAFVCCKHSPVPMQDVHTRAVVRGKTGTCRLFWCTGRMLLVSHAVDGPRETPWLAILLAYALIRYMRTHHNLTNVQVRSSLPTPTYVHPP
jgi:hypothetical protein